MFGFPNISISSLANDASMLVNLGFLLPSTAASKKTEEKLDEDGEADEEDKQDEAEHVQQVVLHPGELQGGGSGGNGEWVTMLRKGIG